MGGPGIFVLIVFVSIFAFIIFGSVFRWKVKGVTGADVIPLRSFWADLPFLVKERAHFLSGPSSFFNRTGLFLSLVASRHVIIE